MGLFVNLSSYRTTFGMCLNGKQLKAIIDTTQVGDDFIDWQVMWSLFRKYKNRNCNSMKNLYNWMWLVN